MILLNGEDVKAHLRGLNITPYEQVVQRVNGFADYVLTSNQTRHIEMINSNVSQDATCWACKSISNKVAPSR